ncbi:23S rRNA methyltransferase attenuation leader peptide [Streptococcus suis]|nr:23S rRNA methyltransferase attenuation leader peptide [Streptococcus suis]NRG70915.1 23S rRNA methyltransferase attenuation leader peptide [Streptococcus suis]NRH07892.1 23S rRNA methyltransferase attenuation leader peptide [Streptococcus suis]
MLVFQMRNVDKTSTF